MMFSIIITLNLYFKDYFKFEIAYLLKYIERECIYTNNIINYYYFCKINILFQNATKK